jgi:hypothetical protein
MRLRSASLSVRWRWIRSPFEAQSRLANALSNSVIDNMTVSRAAAVARAEELSSRALAASPRSASAHYAKGQVLRAQGRP